jgi:SNF2 family DNA or RNA helicase
MRVNPSFALYLEQGCGKTIVALTRLVELAEGGRIDSALIVAPKAVLGSWERDIEKFDRNHQRLLRRIVTLVNYDLVWRRPEYRRHWGAIILDEAHYVKNRTSNRSKALLEMALDADYRYALTGTPISNGALQDIWSQMAFLKPLKIPRGVGTTAFPEAGPTYYNFQDRYCFLDQYFKPYRYRHVDELQEVIAEHSYRVKKVDCLDLPDKLPDEIYEIDLAESKLYKELVKESAIMDLELLAENPLLRMLRLRQLCSGHLPNVDGLKCGKLKALGEYLDGYEDKLVIFAQFTASIDDISELLRKRGIKHVILDGRSKNKTIWRKFQTDDTIRVIVCQYEAAATGIDLFAASTILYYEPTIRSNTLEQSRDRIHRVGQSHPCSYVHFITKGTIEREIYRALQGFADFSEKLFTEYVAEYQRSFRK